jgi:hypothetical protein
MCKYRHYEQMATYEPRAQCAAWTNGLEGQVAPTPSGLVQVSDIIQHSLAERPKL